jgi:hypothetical protein
VRPWGWAEGVGPRLGPREWAEGGRGWGARASVPGLSFGQAASADGTAGSRQLAVMAEPECHKVEWTRLEIGDRSWRVKLEYG